MWTPWLVYDNYPRRKSISIIYIIKKSIMGGTGIIMAYIIHTDYIMPHIGKGSTIPLL